MKALVCVIGTLRGTDVAWRSLLDRVVEPLGADLALLVSDQTSGTVLHRRARYDWSFADPDDWGAELDRISAECGLPPGDWKKSVAGTDGDGMWGGVVTDGGAALGGSGAIVMVLRDMLLRRLEVLRQYDKIIVTRSDHLYLCDHPPLLEEPVLQVPRGEDWWGISDRHHVVDSRFVELYLCVARWWMQNHASVKKRILKHHNPEQLLKLYLSEVGIATRRDERCMVAVAAAGDPTRWTRASVECPGHDGLFLKYPHEYFSHLKKDLVQAKGSPSRTGLFFKKKRVRLVDNF